MVSSFFRRELGAWLPGNIIAELRLRSLEFASLIRPIGDATTRVILRRALGKQIHRLKCYHNSLPTSYA